VNKDLYNKIIDIPKEILDHLTICFERVPNSDSSVEGHKRNEELRSSKNSTFQQLERIDNWFRYYNGKKEDAPYILNGGDVMRNWVTNTIKGLRDTDGFTKKIQNDYMPEEPIDKNFLKDLGPLASQFDPQDNTDNIKIKEDLLRINDLIKKTL
jgi:hypothetical protein